jgi:hypothetical protein
MSGFPVTLVDGGAAPFVPVSGMAPLATMTDGATPITLVESGAPGLIIDGWAPAELGDDLLGQLDAEDTDSLTLDTGVVSAWADTAASVSFANTGTARPAYSATSFNGRPGLTFDGVDDYLSAESAPYPTGANPCEIWALVRQDALIGNTTARAIMAYGGISANASRRTERSNTGGTGNRFRSVTGIGGSTAVATTTADFSGIHIVRAVFGATEMFAAIDGVATAPVAAVSATGTTRSRIGSVTANTPANFMQGAINSIFVTAPLTPVQAASLRAFLGRRGGI